MRIVVDPKELQKTCLELRRQGRTVGLVPTMGYFHQGHVSLMDYVRGRADTVVVSLFVNPTQFGPNEDLDRYPRDFARVRERRRRPGWTICSPPSPGHVRPDASTFVTVDGVSAGLCGARGPRISGGWHGGASFSCWPSPRSRCSGEGRQQLAVIRRMVRDLDIPVAVVGRPIVREADGLALSSRNVFLSGTSGTRPLDQQGPSGGGGSDRLGERDPGTAWSWPGTSWPPTPRWGRSNTWRPWTRSPWRRRRGSRVRWCWPRRWRFPGPGSSTTGWRRLRRAGRAGRAVSPCQVS